MLDTVYVGLSSEWRRLGLGLLLRCDFPVETQVLDEGGTPCLFLSQPQQAWGTALPSGTGQSPDSDQMFRAYDLFFGCRGSEHQHTAKGLSLGNERVDPLRQQGSSLLTTEVWAGFDVVTVYLGT